MPLVARPPFSFAAASLLAAAAAGSVWLGLRLFAAPLASLGPGYPAALAAATPALARLTAVLFAIGSAASLFSRFAPARSTAFWQRGDALARRSPAGWPSWVTLALVCTATVLAFDLPLFVAASFRLDDFELLRANAEESGLAPWLLRTHGGHAYALFRVEWWLLISAFGPSAPAFSVANFAGCTGLLLAGCWLLAEMRIGGLGLAAFILINASWPGWAEFTSGYYTLSAYYQGLGLGCCALACVLRGSRTRDARWGLAANLLMAAALFLAVAHAWLLIAVPLFALTGHPEDSRPPLPPHLFLAAYALALAAFCAYVFAAYVGSWSLGEHGPGALSVGTLLSDTCSGLGGVFLGFVFPIPAGSLNYLGVIGFVELAAVLAVALVVVRLARTLPPHDRRLLLALLAVLTVEVAMISVARRPVINGFFWPAKWTAIAHGTAAILLGLVFDRSLRQSSASTGGRFGVHAAALAAWLLVLLALPAINDALPFGVGRTNALLHARARSAELARLRTACEALSALIGERPVRLPEPAPGHLYRVFPLLEDCPLASVRHALPTGLIEIAPGPLLPRVRDAVATLPQLRRVYLDL